MSATWGIHYNMDWSLGLGIPGYISMKKTAIRSGFNRPVTKYAAAIAISTIKGWIGAQSLNLLRLKPISLRHRTSHEYQDDLVHSHESKIHEQDPDP
jgi:hypothetical protein